MKVPLTGPFQFDPGGLLEFDDARASAEVEQASGPAPKAKGKITVGNIIELAKSRLLELKTEIEQMSELQAEHDELERLLDAASSPVT